MAIFTKFTIMNNNIEEPKVSFEIAKLAKEKGFEQNEYDACYTDNGQYYVSGNLLSERITGKPRPDIQYSAPTQSLLQKWIREKHDMHITIQTGVGSEVWWSFQIIKISTNNLLYNHDGSYDSYEKSLEKGLEETLKLLYDTN